MMRVLLLLAIVYSCSCDRLIPTKDQITLAKITISKLINERVTGPPNGKADFYFIGGFTRLAFHDCVGQGGCDGCIDHTNDGNKGLKEYTDPLNKIWNESFKEIMSRADFWALAAVTGMEMASRDTIFKRFKKKPKFTTRFDANKLKFGRKDCTSATGDEDEVLTAEEKLKRFPSPKGNFQESLAFFRGMFGEDFTPKEYVALMGAHKLGRARIENSGYRGEWIGGKGCSSRLNIKYYAFLFLSGLPLKRKDGSDNPVARVQMPVKPKKGITSNNLQWKRPGRPGIMMNTDIALAWNFNYDKETGKIDCEPCINPKQSENCCSRSPGFKYLMAYRTKKADFIQDFENVIYKMLDLKQEGLAFIKGAEDIPRMVKALPPGKTCNPGWSTAWDRDHKYNSYMEAMTGEGAIPKDFDHAIPAIPSPPQEEAAKYACEKSAVCTDRVCNSKDASKESITELLEDAVEEVDEIIEKVQ